MTRLPRWVCFGIALTFLFSNTQTQGQQGAKNGEWPVYGGDEGSTRYSPLDQINRDTIQSMRVAWVWKADSLQPNPSPNSETTPIMVNGVLYFTMEQRRYVIAAELGLERRCGYTGPTKVSGLLRRPERFTEESLIRPTAVVTNVFCLQLPAFI